MDTFSAHIAGSLKDIRPIYNGFERGRENPVCFTNPNVWHAYREARESAKFFASLIEETPSIPFVSQLGPMVGRIVGSQTPDGSRGWRIDWDSIKLLHVNWWDHTADPARRDKSLLLYGANYVSGGSQDIYWQIVEHFPNPLWSPV